MIQQPVFFGHLRQRTHDLTAWSALGGFLEQAHVQLEDIRLQREHAVKLGVAGTEVIDGNACTGLTIARHHLGQTLDVTAQFGDLEHNALRIDAMRMHLLQAGQGLAGAQTVDPAGRDVQAQKPVCRRFMQAAQGIVADLPVEAAQGHAWRARVGKQRAD
jgi:hypothetical protein